MSVPLGPRRQEVRAGHPVIGPLVALVLLLAGCGADSPAEQLPFTGAEVSVRAVNIAFEPAELKLPPGVPLRIVLDDADDGILHNVRVFQGDRELGKSPMVTGPGRTEVRFGPLPSARYQFTCDVHPNMIGTLIVAP